MAVNLNCVICEVNFWDAAGFDKERALRFLVDNNVFKGETDCGRSSAFVQLDEEFIYSSFGAVSGLTPF